MDDLIFKIRGSDGSYVKHISGGGYIGTGKTAKVWQSYNTVKRALDKCHEYTDVYPDVSFEIETYRLMKI